MTAGGPVEVLLPQGGHTLQVTVDGPEGGAPLVLLPSSQRDASDLADCAAALAAGGFRVLRPWPRGMGASDGALAGLSLSVLAADAVHALRELAGGQPAIWVGHAFGHFVARVADLEHPALVRGVVVVAAAAREFPAGVPQTLATGSDSSKPEAERLAALRAGFFAPGNDPAPWLHGWYPSLRDAYKNAGTQPPKSTWWPVTHAPILDLQGADDPWRPPATREELKEALGKNKVTVHVIEAASHALPFERPHEVARAIDQWSQTLPA